MAPSGDDPLPWENSVHASTSDAVYEPVPSRRSVGGGQAPPGLSRVPIGFHVEGSDSSSLPDVDDPRAIVVTSSTVPRSQPGQQRQPSIDWSHAREPGAHFFPSGSDADLRAGGGAAEAAANVGAHGMLGANNNNNSLGPVGNAGAAAPPPSLGGLYGLAPATGGDPFYITEDVPGIVWSHSVPFDSAPRDADAGYAAPNTTANANHTASLGMTTDVDDSGAAESAKRAGRSTRLAAPLPVQVRNISMHQLPSLHSPAPGSVQRTFSAALESFEGSGIFPDRSLRCVGPKMPGMDFLALWNAWGAVGDVRSVFSPTPPETWSEVLDPVGRVYVVSFFDSRVAELAFSVALATTNSHAGITHADVDVPAHVAARVARVLCGECPDPARLVSDAESPVESSRCGGSVRISFSAHGDPGRAAATLSGYGDLAHFAVTGIQLAEGPTGAADHHSDAGDGATVGPAGGVGGKSNGGKSGGGGGGGGMSNGVGNGPTASAAAASGPAAGAGGSIHDIRMGRVVARAVFHDVRSAAVLRMRLAAGQLGEAGVSLVEEDAQATGVPRSSSMPMEPQVSPIIGRANSAPVNRQPSGLSTNGRSAAAAPPKRNPSHLSTQATNASSSNNGAKSNANAGANGGSGNAASIGRAGSIASVATHASQSSTSSGATSRTRASVHSTTSGSSVGSSSGSGSSKGGNNGGGSSRKQQQSSQGNNNSSSSQGSHPHHQAQAQAQSQSQSQSRGRRERKDKRGTGEGHFHSQQQQQQQQQQGGGGGGGGGGGDGGSTSSRGGRSNSTSSDANVVDTAAILAGTERRSSIMIRNIPNKYTQQMLLEALSEVVPGRIDFLYLPIDFRNKCNVGYAFLNLIDPKDIVVVYDRFVGKRWDRFNSNKTCAISFGRIQSKPALIKHFQRSQIMLEDKSFQPLVFSSVTGEPEDFPVPPLKRQATRDSD